MIEAPALPDSAAPARRPNVLRRLYQWVLGWADHPYGTWALCVISFAESSFFPIPPDVLQIALSVSKPKRSFHYATASAVSSVLGGIMGWVIGIAFWAVVGDFFLTYIPGFSPENFAKVQSLYEDNAFLAIVAAAFTPIPYKVFTVAAGVFDISIWTLVAASAVGRSGRFFLVATSIYFVGPRIKVYLDKYFELATLILFALVVAGFLAIKFLAR
jgi:membrane protein YqaA with SNARE-associated domain